MNRQLMRSMTAVALCCGWFAASPARSEDPAYWKWAPAPPMGWNSYDNFGDSVTEAEFRSNANYLKEHLLPHGWMNKILSRAKKDYVAIPLENHQKQQSPPVECFRVATGLE